MRIVIIVQARMGSTRLPGKVLRKVAGKPLLGYLIERLRKVKQMDHLVVATTHKAEDQIIVDYCQALHTDVFRGSEENVLDRYIQAGKFASADIVVRITADCPIIDPQIVDQLITFYLAHDYHFVSNALMRTFPYGMEVEVFSLKDLIRAADRSTTAEEQEHVTPVFYLHPKSFKIFNVTFPEDLSRYRLTVDTPADFEVVKHLIEILYPSNPFFNLNEMILLLKEHPEWVELNAHIPHKTLKSLGTQSE